MVVVVEKENNRNVVVVVVEENNRNVAVVLVVVEGNNINLVEKAENNIFMVCQTYINAQNSTFFVVYILLLRS